jgi:putative DNA primase/helicase
MTSTARAIAGNENKILSYYSLPPVTGARHFRGECPICGQKDSFRLNHKNGNLLYICKCGSGDILKLICEVTGKEFKVVAGEIDELTGRKFNKADVAKPRAEMDKFMQKYNSLLQLAGSPAETYLNRREIWSMPPHSVRFSVSEFDKEYNSNFLSMYAIATDEFNKPCMIHKTYITPDGFKASVEKPKKMRKLAHSESIAVKLFPVKSTLGVAEGIETSLSANFLYKLPVWAMLNGAIMKNFKAPRGVDTLIIFADSDQHGAGLASAFVCANKNLLSNNDVEKVIVRWPEKHGTDFNDLHRGAATDVLEIRLEWSKKL